MTDPGRPSAASFEAAPSEAELRALLHAAGVPEAEVDQAWRDGLVPLLAIAAFVLDPPRHDLGEAARLTGMAPDRLRQVWSALGFPSPRDGELLFDDTDIELLKVVDLASEQGLADPEVVLQMTRVTGAALAQVAGAQADALSRRDPEHQLDLVRAADLFSGLFERVLSQVWRRHLQVAARLRLTTTEGIPVRIATVGFADLVGFTSLSQQLDERSLAHVVARFEAVAYRIIGAHGGRVVKMIGDEVMFDVDDPVVAVRCALELADSYHDADDLSDVRVGLAHGSVLDRGGDLYGPTVNLASRITAIALPSTVVVDQSVHDAVEDHADFAVRTLLPRRLKHIGRVPLWAVRHATDAPDDRERRRARRRARVLELVLDPPDEGAAAGR